MDQIQKNILEKVHHMLHLVGVKGTTMDSVAADLGMSKKTLYQWFDNKEDMLRQACLYNHKIKMKVLLDSIQQIDCPIEEQVYITGLICSQLNLVNSNIILHMETLYPKLSNEIRNKTFDMRDNIIRTNLTTGIQRGLYRKEIDIDSIIELYFSVLDQIFQPCCFQGDIAKTTHLFKVFNDYHLRAICTPKGLEKYQALIKPTN